MAFLGLGMLYGGAMVGIPTVTGVAEGVHYQKEQNKEASNEARMVKFHLDVYCGEKSAKAKHVHDTIVVLKDKKVYLSHKRSLDRQPLAPPDGGPAPHPFTGFYITYPDEDRDPPERGLVSTISNDPPMLNWIYVDRETLELKHGNRTQSIQHIVGPWDWTEDEVGLTLEAWEGFVAVEEDNGEWALYYDINDDRLANGEKVGGKQVLQCSLERRVYDETRQQQEMDAAEKKLQVKKTGELTTKWG